MSTILITINTLRDQITPIYITNSTAGNTNIPKGITILPTCITKYTKVILQNRKEITTLNYLLTNFRELTCLYWGLVTSNTDLI
jgi:hypothetical protein